MFLVFAGLNAGHERQTHSGVMFVRVIPLKDLVSDRS